MADIQIAPSSADRASTSATGPAPGWMVVGVVAYLVIAAITLFALLAALMSGKQSDAITLNLGIGVWTLTLDVRLLVVAGVSGALGSFIHAATSLADYIGNQRIVASWLPWYLLRPLIGASLAVVLYFLMRAGLLSAAESGNVDLHGVAAVAALAGMFSKQATDKLDEIFSTMFRTTNKTGDSQRSHKLDDQAPRVATVAPPTLAVGGASPQLVIGGANLSEDAVVMVNDAARPTRFDNGKLVVELTKDDVARAGALSVVVKNPDGDVSARISVPVQ